MMKKMIDYVTFSDRRFCALWFVILVVGLILMISTVSTGYLDEIEFSDSYEVVLFIIFVLGMSLSFIGVSVIINVYLTSSLRNRIDR